MMAESSSFKLPYDLTEFLREGGQLIFNGSKGGSSHSKLKSRSSLESIKIRAVTEHNFFQNERNEFYEMFAGGYVVDVVPLLEESYDLLWIPYLEMYGAYDDEHEHLVIFTLAKWADIVADPARFLDFLIGEISEPIGTSAHWLYLPYVVEVVKPHAVIEPYFDLCPLHGAPIIKKALEPLHPDDEDLYRVYEKNYIKSLVSKFPCRGVPDCQGSLSYCDECARNEVQWREKILKKEENSKSITVKMNKVGWIKCTCGYSFRLIDKFTVERDGMRYLKRPSTRCWSCRSKITIENLNDPIQSPFGKEST